MSVFPSALVSGFCLDDFFLTAQPFVTKLGKVVYYHQLECLVEKEWFAI